MGDKEILAEYKIAYEQLQDIIDNAMEGQITAEEVDKIEKIQYDLNILYKEMYNRIKEKEDVSLYYEEDLLISDEISADYISVGDDVYITYDDDMYISYKNLDNEDKWWEDYDFLTKF